MANSYIFKKISHFFLNEFTLLTILSLIYFVILLFNIGNNFAPQTSWTSSDEKLIASINLNDNKYVKTFEYFDGNGNASYTLEILNSKGEYEYRKDFDTQDFYKWRSIEIKEIISGIRITAENTDSSINEIALFDNNQNIISATKSSNSNLIDEQSQASYIINNFNGTYFDEIYHPRTAYEFIHHLPIYENTHPPLGKIIISLGIMIFGMNPFGWRIMGVIFSAMLIPIMYFFGKLLFKSKAFGFLTSILTMFEFMFFVQGRIGTLDVIELVFILLMYYFMSKYYINKLESKLYKREHLNLFLSGLFFGIGLATKWISAYAGVGLAIIFFMLLVLDIKNFYKEEKRVIIIKQFKTILFATLSFVIIPLIIYFCAYIPWLLTPGITMKDVLENQTGMYEYHSQLVATHPFSSQWWEWPTMNKPLWMYTATNLPQDYKSVIVSLGNPAIWWLGILTIPLSIILTIYYKERRMFIVFIGILSQYIPWMLVPRITFIYHYLSVLPFLIFTIVYCSKILSEKFAYGKYLIFLYIGIVITLFIMFYPILSGLIMPESYIDNLRWFRSWIW